MYYQKSIITFQLIFFSLCCRSEETLQQRMDRIEQTIEALAQVAIMTPQGSLVASNQDDSKQNSHHITVNEPKERVQAYQSPKLVIRQKFPQDFPKAFQTLLSFLENQQSFIKARAKIPNKFLFYGPPGCGKSYLAELIAQEFQLPMIYLKASDLEDKYYGESSKKITEVFNYRDPKGRPVILFIDEIDAIAFQRNDRMFEGSRATINALLIELQKHSFDPSIIIIVATNNKQILDEAIMSRFEGLCVEILPMTEQDRELFVEDILSGRCIENRPQTIKEVAKATKGLSRRAVSTALESAYSWSIAKNGNGGHPLTAEDVSFFIRQAKRDGATSRLVALKKFINNVQPYLNFTHLTIGTTVATLQLLGHPWIASMFYKTNVLN